MTDNKTSKTPSHEAFVVEGEGDNAYWMKVGALWPHNDGKGFSLKLSCLPIDGRLTIRTRKEDKKEKGR